MPYNEALADRIRELLSELPKVEEKKMFRGVAFMVNDKLCISVAAHEIMCRIDPAIHEELLDKNGVRTMRMKSREYIGYVLVDEEVLKTKKALSYWVDLALSFNKQAKSSKKKK